MKFKSLQTKLVIIFGLCIFISTGAAVVHQILSAKSAANFVTNSSNEFTADAAKAQLLDKAKAIGLYVRAELEVALDAARSMADVFAGVKDQSVNLKIDRNQINGILRTALSRNETFVGTYTCWEPNALDKSDELHVSAEGHDKTGRFIPYWSRDKDGKIGLVPLEDYENHDKHENGVRKGDYYLLTRERKKECAIDPYPYPIHDKIVWITSLVAPIVSDRVFYGIAGVDMRLDFIQSVVEKINATLYGGAGSIAAVQGASRRSVITGFWQQSAANPN